MMRLLAVLIPTLYELKKATSMYSETLSTPNFAYSVLPILRRELKSSLATISATLAVAVVISFSLVKVLQQAELYLRQFNYGDVMIFGFYCLVLLVSSLGLFLMLTSKPAPLPDVPQMEVAAPVDVRRQPLEAIVNGLSEGFNKGLAKREPLRLLSNGYY